MAKDRSITLDDISRGIDKGLDTVDQQRAAALERLQLARNAKAAGLRKEQTRLTAKYGPNHPRVQAVSARIAAGRGLAQDLARETERAKTELPVVDEQTWVLHGFVRDQSGKGVPKLTIALYDGSGTAANWVKELGYTCTNDRGYFKMEARNLKDRPAAQAFLRVLNSQGAALYIDSRALTPKAGRIDYREIIIGDEIECPPPPPPPSADQWSVRGQVIDPSGAALPNLTLGLSDKERLFAARLGQTRTDISGRFTLSYRADDFRDLVEKKPDLFLEVSGGGLKELYTHPEALHFQPGRADNVIVTVKAESVELKPWTVRGEITDTSGKPLAGYVLDFADKERKVVSRLGQSAIKANGQFVMTYRSEDFRDLIEQQTPLFLRVSGQSLRQPYIDSTELRFEPGRVANLKIVVKIDTAETKSWVVRGRVADSAGAALPGLTVGISDRERKFAERLGKTQTGRNGEFELSYQAEAFADLTKEPVDLVVQVLDANGKVLYTHDQALRFAPGKVDSLSIVIKR